MKELGALRRGQVWLTLATGAIGFGGLFSVYTYLASTMLEVTHASPSAGIPPMLGHCSAWASPSATSSVRGRPIGR